MDDVDKEVGREESIEKDINFQSQPESRKKSTHWLKSLGPGLITGASDDDPSGIATYSQAGAQFGFGMLWMAIFQYPMMTVIQEMCARIGLLTGKGLTTIIKRKYSKKVVLPLTSLLLIANTINIGADIGAMAASVRLVFPQLPIIVATLSFTVFIVASQILLPYNKYVKILKYLTISLFAYIVTVVIVGGSWAQILASSIIPHIELTPAFAMMFVAILGTTITPYVFFWQASQEAEENVAKGKIKEISEDNKVSSIINASNVSKQPKISKKEVSLMRSDTAIGMAFSQLIMWAIITTTAGSLHSHNITDIQTADQAAKALQPLVKTFPNAGEIAQSIFALGIIGTGLIAIPVMAGSSAYALSDLFGWKQGLNKTFRQANAFYLVIAASSVIGLWINFSSIDPIKALVYTAVINGVVAVPILIAIMRIANDKTILKDSVNGQISNIIGWATVMIMGISVVILFATWGSH
ncbi:MAG TPA: Nramp family divalent metal transporter [Candidatus Nitrosopolaris sp.]|nr:Nramp family divalent metal transporter [Candidatus Nitrosopolaris sp.]